MTSTYSETLTFHGRKLLA